MWPIIEVVLIMTAFCLLPFFDVNIQPKLDSLIEFYGDLILPYALLRAQLTFSYSKAVRLSLKIMHLLTLVGVILFDIIHVAGVIKHKFIVTEYPVLLISHRF